MSGISCDSSQYMTKRQMTVVLACIINLCAGANYAWSIFAQSLAEHLSNVSGAVVTSGTLAFAFSLACIASPVSMILSGRIADKYGPRYILMFSGLSLAIGFIGAALSTSATAVIVFYGVFVGAGMGSAFNAGMANVLKFFPDKGGMMGGIVSTCFGASAVLVPLIVMTLLTYFDIVTTLMILGVVFGAIISVAGFLTTGCPADFKPKGWTPKVLNTNYRDFNTTEMVRTKVFYAMFGLAFCGTLPGMMLISQAARIAVTQMQFNLAQAALIVSIVAVSNMSGRIIGGALSDRFGRIQVLMGMGIGLNLIGCTALVVCDPDFSAIFYLGIVSLGLSLGCMNGIFPSFTTSVFGRKFNTLNYAVMIIALALPGVLGPVLMNSAYSDAYLFDLAFGIGIIISVIGLGFGFLYRKYIRELDRFN